MSSPGGGLRFDANLKWLFTELPFERRFDAAAAAGFAAVEYASPYEYGAEKLTELLRNSGLRQILINTPAGPPGSPTRSGLACLPDHVEEFRDGVRLGLEYAVALHSNFLHVMAGIRPRGVSRDRAFACLVANMTWAAEQARNTGVLLLLEEQNKTDAPNFVLESQQHAAAVVQAVGPGVGLLFDFYHAQIDEGNLVNTLTSVLPHVLHMQIADPPGRNEPGTGEINWPTIFEVIRGTRYSGWIGCEYRPKVDTVSGLRWIKDLDM